MQKLLTGLRWAAAAATVIVALLLCWQCFDIYQGGNAPDNLDPNGVHLTPVYSVEKVSARLQPLTPVFWGYAALVLAALCVQAACTPRGEKLSASAENRLRLLRARVAEMPQAALAEERRRRRLCVAAGVLVAACAAISLVYLLDGAHFTSWELEGVMGQMLWHVAPWVLVAFAVMIAASLACGASVEKEIEALRQAPKAAPAQESPAPNARWTTAVRVAVLVVSAAFIVLGVMNGGLYDVLVKAINICTECIGLG